MADTAEAGAGTAFSACLLCSDSFPVDSGVLCRPPVGTQAGAGAVGAEAAGTEGSHFVCRECLNKYAREQLAGEHMNEGKLRCPYIHAVGAGRIEPQHRCSAPPWTAFDLQHVLESATFAAMVQGLHAALKLREDIIEAQRRELAEAHRHGAGQGGHGQVAQVARDILEQAGPGGEAERIERIRKRIVEQVFNMYCPRCRAVFVDYSGCDALTCTACGCSFCALCLIDCGRNAHRHVVERHGGLWGGAEHFKSVHAHRRLGLLQAAVSALDDHGRPFQDALLRALQADLDGVGLRAEQVRREGEGVARMAAPAHVAPAPAPTPVHLGPAAPHHPRLARHVVALMHAHAPPVFPEEQEEEETPEEAARMRRLRREYNRRLEAMQRQWDRRHGHGHGGGGEGGEGGVPLEVLERRFEGVPRELQVGIQAYLDARLPPGAGGPQSVQAWIDLLPPLFAAPRARLGSRHYERCSLAANARVVGAQEHFYVYSLANMPAGGAQEWVYDHFCPHLTCAVSPRCGLCLDPLLPRLDVDNIVTHHYAWADARHRAFARQAAEERERVYMGAHRARLDAYARALCRKVCGLALGGGRPGAAVGAGGREALLQYRNRLEQLGRAAVPAVYSEAGVDLCAILSEEVARAPGAAAPDPPGRVPVPNPAWAPAAHVAAAFGPGRARGGDAAAAAVGQGDGEGAGEADPDPVPDLDEEDLRQLAAIDEAVAQAEQQQRRGGVDPPGAHVAGVAWHQSAEERADFVSQLQRQLEAYEGRPLDEEERRWDAETLQEAILAYMAAE